METLAGIFQPRSRVSWHVSFCRHFYGKANLRGVETIIKVKTTSSSVIPTSYRDWQQVPFVFAA